MCVSGFYNVTAKKCNATEKTNGGWPKVCIKDADCTGTLGNKGYCKCGAPT
jgi:hypothetical protein